MKRLLTLGGLLVGLTALGQFDLTRPEFLANLAASSAGATFSSNNPSGLAIWLNPDDISGSDTNGALVTNWLSRVGGQRLRSWVGGANSAVYTNFNSKPAVGFAANRNFIGPSGIVASNFNLTWFFVLRPANLSDVELLDDNGAGIQMHWHSGGKLAYQYGTLVSGPSSAAQTPQVLVFKLVAPSGSKVWTNGVSAGFTTTTYSRRNINAALRFGGYTGGGGFDFTGDWGDFLLYTNALSDAEIKLVNNYLAGKYGLPLMP